MNRPLSMPIALCVWEFWITDKSTGIGINGARIKIWWDDPLTGHNQYALYTDKSGYATIKTFQYYRTYLTLEHPSYITREEGPFDSRTGYLGLNYSMMMSGVPPSGVTATIYAQADLKKWYVVGKITGVGIGEYAFTQDYPYKAVIYGLAENMVYTIQASGYYGEMGKIPTEFNIPFQLAIMDKNVEIWVDVLTGEIHIGKPPVPPPDSQDFVDWLMRNWKLALVGFVGLIFAPEIIRSIKGVARE